MSNRIKIHHAAGLMLSTAVMLILAAPVRAEDAADPSILRVCASEVEAPYSMRGAEGFENKIAKALATAMDRKVKFVWTEKPAIYLGSRPARPEDLRCRYRSRYRR